MAKSEEEIIAELSSFTRIPECRIKELVRHPELANYEVMRIVTPGNIDIASPKFAQLCLKMYEKEMKNNG